MPTLNEVKQAALIVETGATPPVTINELEMIWLRSRGHTGTINEMWKQEFADGGFTGQFNDSAFGWLQDFGFAGTLNEKWYQFWTEGGSTNPNLVINSRFTTDTAWTKGQGWTIAGGTAIHDTALAVSSLSQAVPFQIGVGYRMRYDIVGYGAGALTVTAGGVTFTPRIAVGSYVEKFTGLATTGLFLEATTSLVAKVDNVYVVEIADTP